MIVGADITHCNSPLLFSSPEGTWNTSNFHNKSIVSFYCDQHNNTAITNTHAVSVCIAICALLVCRVTLPESLEVIMHEWGPSDSWFVSLGFPVNLHGGTWNSASHKQLKTSVEGFGSGAPQTEGQSRHGMPRQRGGICPPWFMMLPYAGYPSQIPDAAPVHHVWNAKVWSFIATMCYNEMHTNNAFKGSQFVSRLVWNDSISWMQRGCICWSKIWCKKLMNPTDVRK